MPRDIIFEVYFTNEWLLLNIYPGNEDSTNYRHTDTTNIYFLYFITLVQFVEVCNIFECTRFLSKLFIYLHSIINQHLTIQHIVGASYVHFDLSFSMQQTSTLS